MNELLNYQVVHYYHNKTALEFINIGIIVYNSNSFSFKFIQEDMENFSCSLFNKKALTGTIDYLKNILSSCSSYDDFKKHTLYLDNFSFSKPMISKVYSNFNDEVNYLYHDYIAYKFEKPKEVFDRKEEIKRISKEVIIKKFKRYASYTEKENFDFVIDVKKNNVTKQYPTVIGSLLNDGDISRVLKTILHHDIGQGVYAYTNANDDLVRHHVKAQKARETLENKLSFLPKDFSTKDSIEVSIDRLLIA